MAPNYPKVYVDDPFAVPPDTLGMEVEEMRRLGHKVVDMVIDRAMRRNEEPAILTGDPADLLGKLGGPLPETPMDPDASLELMAEVALSNQQHGDHPRYFARVPGPTSFAAILGEWMGTGSLCLLLTRSGHRDSVQSCCECRMGQFRRSWVISRSNFKGGVQ